MSTDRTFGADENSPADSTETPLAGAEASTRAVQEREQPLENTNQASRAGVMATSGNDGRNEEKPVSGPEAKNTPPPESTGHASIECMAEAPPNGEALGKGQQHPLPGAEANPVCAVQGRDTRVRSALGLVTAPEQSTGLKTDWRSEPFEKFAAFAEGRQLEREQELSEETQSLVSDLGIEFKIRLLERVDYPVRNRGLTDDMFFRLFLFFVLEEPESTAVSYLKTSDTTAELWYRRLQQKILWAAVEHRSRFFGLGEILRDEALTRELFFPSQTRKPEESAMAVQRRLTLRRKRREGENRTAEFGRQEEQVLTVELFARALSFRDSLVALGSAKRRDLTERALRLAFVNPPRSRLPYRVPLPGDKFSNASLNAFLDTNGIALERHRPALRRGFAWTFIAEYLAVLNLDPLSTQMLEEQEFLKELPGLLALPLD